VLNFKVFMKHKTLLPLLGLAAVFIGSCQNMPPHETALSADTTVKFSSKTVDLPDTATQHKVGIAPAFESVTEDFEQASGSKSSYITAEITFRTGAWVFGDALLGNSEADHKNGGHAVRIRNTGKFSMQFDLAQVRQVSISHAVYGEDASSSWQLWVSRDHGRTYKQVAGTVHTTRRTLTPAQFTLNGEGTLRFEIRKTAGGKNRINIDDIVVQSATQPVAGNPTVTVNTQDQQNAKPKATDDGNLLLGNPSAATSTVSDANNYLIDHQYYVASYNNAKAAPNWVSWHISAKDLGKAKRANDFRPDTSLPAGWYEADNTSYKGSGFDKGHNCPSGDRTSSSSANSSTFLMSNMVPQAPNNNQHTWEHLESYCRDQVKKGNEVYVVMGSYGTGGTGTNGYRTTIAQGRISVPAHIWKLVVIIPDGNDDLNRININTRVIAVDTPNNNSISSNWMDYSCSVRAIEKATGYDLLSALPRKVQDVLELKTFKGGN
jgi:endonuclease G